MRTDVKLGVIGSLVVVVLAGWYFTARDTSESTIPIEQGKEVPEKAPLLTGTPERKPEASETPPEDETEPPELVMEGDLPAEFEDEGDEPVAPPVLFPPTEELAEQEPTRSEGRDQGESAKQDLLRSAQEEAARRLADARKEGQRPETLRPTARRGAATRRQSATQQRPAARGARPTPTARMETHTVRPGDTFARLARIYYGDVRHADTLQEANPHVDDPSAIAVGTTVYLPEIADSIARTPPPRRTSPAGSTRSDGRRYTVQEGDSLYEIAREKLGAGSRWEEIYKLNKAVIGEDPARLKVGQVLTLPAN